jgi:hypothetical protein
MQFETGASYTITGYKIHAAQAEGDDAPLTLALYADSSGEKGALIEGTSISIAASAMTEFPTMSDEDLPLDTPKTGINGTYWLSVSTASGSSYFFKYGAKTGGRAYFSGVSGYIDGYTISVTVYGCAE